MDGDFLNGYYVGDVALTADVHEAITAPDPDDALIDHTGRLLQVMAGNSGMGMTWKTYHPIARVLDAHVTHLVRQHPTRERYDPPRLHCRPPLERGARYPVGRRS